MPSRANARPTIKVSRWQLDVFCKCPRCFWLLKRHAIKPPETYPLALNNVMDTLLKAEFDEHRAAGTLPPILADAKMPARLFRDAARLAEWRDNFQGLRWTEAETGHTLFGAIDDLLEYPDGRLAVIDYKSSGAASVNIYDSYQFQMDVYTFLLERLGFRTAGKAFFAFFVAVRDDGFRGRLPFRATLVEIIPQPERALDVFRRAIAVAQSDQMPETGAGCDLCRWASQSLPIVQLRDAQPSRPVEPPAVPVPAAVAGASAVARPRRAKKSVAAICADGQSHFAFDA